MSQTPERRSDYPNILERLARIEERQIAIDKRINGSIDDIKTHINAGTKWRASILAVFAAIIIQVVIFSYVYGCLSKTVEVNERVIERMLENQAKGVHNGNSKDVT